MSPYHPSRGLGERRELPQVPSGVRGGVDVMHIQVQKEATWETLLSILSDGGAPKNVAGPGKTPPFLPLDGPVNQSVNQSIVLFRQQWPISTKKQHREKEMTDRETNEEKARNQRIPMASLMVCGHDDD